MFPLCSPFSPWIISLLQYHSYILYLFISLLLTPATRIFFSHAHFTFIVLFHFPPFPSISLLLANVSLVSALSLRLANALYVIWICHPVVIHTHFFSFPLQLLRLAHSYISVHLWSEYFGTVLSICFSFSLILSKLLQASSYFRPVSLFTTLCPSLLLHVFVLFPFSIFSVYVFPISPSFICTVLFLYLFLEENPSNAHKAFEASYLRTKMPNWISKTTRNTSWKTWK